VHTVERCPTWAEFGVDNDDTRAALAMLVALLDGSHLASPDQLPHVVDRAASAMGWGAVVHLVDYEQRLLVPFGSDAPAAAVSSTDAGRAFRHTVPVSGQVDDVVRHVWVPLVDGVERLGVIDVTLPAATVIDEPALQDHLRWFAFLAGHLIASKSPYGDAMQRARLSRTRTVASELIWSLLPPLTVAHEGVVISGLLEPAHAVAGDVFDYAIDDGIARVAIMDATGHDLRSGAIGAIALAAYRNSRRRALNLADSMMAVDEALAEFETNTYATGVFGELDIANGHFHYLNAGHPRPLLVRNGSVRGELIGGRRPLFGLAPLQGEPATEVLQPGDWIVLYTDGVTEARDRQRQFFGLDRLVHIVESCVAEGHNAPETLRRITQEILDHQQGMLQDDATLLLIQWRTGLEHHLYPVLDSD
jgi:sigma-B regulation protein RsbU (phosphoserine phosphatase)